MSQGYSAIDALVEGCSVCEREQCDFTVGYGGSPDENGETTLDAMIMDGSSMNIGAVAALRNVKDAISVAKHVLLNTKHTLLVGDQATQFALKMGFVENSLQTNQSTEVWKNWKNNNCQPNFWTDVSPDPSATCGPYQPISNNDVNSLFLKNSPETLITSHDTIGMLIIDKNGKIVAGTSTNGATHKIPGRVGDSPIPGSGAYANGKIGAAAATGNGDILMRFMPSLMAVEYLRSNNSPSKAGELALRRILEYYTSFMGAIVVVNKDGEYGAACTGLDRFPFSIYDASSNAVRIEYVSCI